MSFITFLNQLYVIIQNYFALWKPWLRSEGLDLLFYAKASANVSAWLSLGLFWLILLGLMKPLIRLRGILTNFFGGYVNDQLKSIIARVLFSKLDKQAGILFMVVLLGISNLVSTFGVTIISCSEIKETVKCSEDEHVPSAWGPRIILLVLSIVLGVVAQVLDLHHTLHYNFPKHLAALVIPNIAWSLAVFYTPSVHANVSFFHFVLLVIRFAPLSWAAGMLGYTVWARLMAAVSAFIYTPRPEGSVIGAINANLAAWRVDALLSLALVLRLAEWTVSLQTLVGPFLADKAKTTLTWPYLHWIVGVLTCIFAVWVVVGIVRTMHLVAFAYFCFYSKLRFIDAIHESELSPNKEVQAIISDGDISGEGQPQSAAAVLTWLFGPMSGDFGMVPAMCKLLLMLFRISQNAPWSYDVELRVKWNQSSKLCNIGKGMLIWKRQLLDWWWNQTYGRIFDSRWRPLEFWVIHKNGLPLVRIIISRTSTEPISLNQTTECPAAVVPLRVQRTIFGHNVLRGATMHADVVVVIKRALLGMDLEVNVAQFLQESATSGGAGGNGGGNAGPGPGSAASAPLGPVVVPRPDEEANRLSLEQVISTIMTILENIKKDLAQRKDDIVDSSAAYNALFDARLAWVVQRAGEGKIPKPFEPIEQFAPEEGAPRVERMTMPLSDYHAAITLYEQATDLRDHISKMIQEKRSSILKRKDDLFKKSLESIQPAAQLQPARINNEYEKQAKELTKRADQFGKSIRNILVKSEPAAPTREEKIKAKEAKKEEKKERLLVTEAKAREKAEKEEAARVEKLKQEKAVEIDNDPIVVRRYESIEKMEEVLRKEVGVAMKKTAELVEGRRTVMRAKALDKLIEHLQQVLKSARAGELEQAFRPTIRKRRSRRRNWTCKNSWCCACVVGACGGKGAGHKGGEVNKATDVHGLAWTLKRFLDAYPIDYFDELVKSDEEIDLFKTFFQSSDFVVMVVSEVLTALAHASLREEARETNYVVLAAVFFNIGKKLMN